MIRFVPLLVLLACGGSAPTAETCADICAAGKAAPDAKPEAVPDAKPASGGDLSAYEQKVVGPVIEDLRAGVRPWDDKSVGICEGKDKCDEFLGAEVSELPHGNYMLQAVLRVPKQGDNWKITLTTDCTTMKGDNTSTKGSSKDYDVKYGNEERGYRLVPLRRIESPGKHGKQSCAWKITAPHPDGDKVYEGSWSVPE